MSVGLFGGCYSLIVRSPLSTCCFVCVAEPGGYIWIYMRIYGRNKAVSCAENSFLMVFMQTVRPDLESWTW